MSGALTTTDRSWTTIAWINTSITSLPLVDPLDDIMIIGRAIGYLKYNNRGC
jgi:hypothetical protein